MIIFRGSSGINNKIDTVRLNTTDVIQDMAYAINVYVDPSGMVCRQKSTSQLVSGEFKSICPFDCGGYTLVKKKEGNSWSLMTMDPDGNLTGIRSGMGNGRVDYEKASDGEKDWVYYVDGETRGRVCEGSNYVWDNSQTYFGPDTTATFDDPPNGHLLTLFNGRMYIAKDNVLYASKVHDFNRFNLEEDYFPFSSKITMLNSVDGGLWVSDEQGIYFLPGSDPQGDSFGFKKKSGKSIITGTDIKIEAEYVGAEFSGEVILAWSDFGLHILGENGFLNTPTKNKLIRRTDSASTNYLPDSTTGGSVIINDERIISTFS